MTRIDRRSLRSIVFLAAMSATGLANGQFIRGDANSDGSVELSDAVFLLGALYIPGSDPLDCLDAGDVDDDGSVNVADAIQLLSHLFVVGSPAPPAPFPTPGLDPTADALGDCGGGTSLPITVLAQGEICGAGPQESIIRDAAEFELFWASFASTFLPPPPVPVVDFSEQMVVVVVQSFTTGGAFVAIEDVVAIGSGVEVHTIQGVPLGGCPVTFALTQPHSIVVCPTAAGDPVLIQDALVDTCF